MTDWHADSALLRRYAGGDLDDVTASSVEAHVVACPQCGERIAAHVPPARVRANWTAVADALDAPAPGALERLLGWCGVRGPTARLLAATPTLRLSWMAAVALAIAFAVAAAARPGGAAVLFLAVAPLVPVAAVAVAFNPSLDPSSEVTAATPVAGLRLVLLRAVASLGPSIVLAAAAGPLVSDVGGSWAAWLLPALALSASSLLLASVVPVARAASALGALWAVGVVAAEAGARGSLAAVRSGGDAESFLVQMPAQVLAGGVAVAAAVLAATRTREPAGSFRRQP